MKLIACLTLATLVVAPYQIASSNDPSSSGQFNNDHGYNMIQLDITGDAGTRFHGGATLYAEGDAHYHELDGIVPIQLTFQGEGIDLELTQVNEGNLNIELLKNGNRSSSRVSGLGSRVQLSVR
ncbi:hypothetical protein [uncultured Halomonas sp.]|uniref:hypothetical protein n=1 Tax=uncultured Halomonas sp. TaxID=173971 RepID=UPI00260CB6C3|nr:hypothetical protein [uncultured Halomonas sp.]